MRKKRANKPDRQGDFPETNRAEILIRKYFARLMREEISDPTVHLDQDRVFAEIKQKIVQKKQSERLVQLRIVASFIGFICLSAFAYWFYVSGTRPDGEIILTAENASVKPGSDRATLTLADGSVVDLTDRASGQIASQGGVLVSKTSTGELLYHRGETPGVSENAYNSVTTPRGGQFVVSLPDGSRVWLNADSKLKFSTSTNGTERAVELIGEGYFEVKTDPERPFKIKSKGQVVTVLGTKFNINSYEDEAFIRTTLLEGSVQVNSGGREVVLEPGEQAAVREEIKIRKVNAKNFVSWKNGDFVFRNESITDIMRQVSRWYDVSVEYEGSAENLAFGGIVSRSNELSAVLTMLEKTGKVKFEVLMNNETKERRVRVIFI